MKNLLLNKGFTEINDNQFMITLTDENVLKEYFSMDADNYEKVTSGEITQIELFVYPETEGTEWRIGSNDNCIEDDYEGVLEFINKYL